MPLTSPRAQCSCEESRSEGGREGGREEGGVSVTASEQVKRKEINVGRRGFVRNERAWKKW